MMVSKPNETEIVIGSIDDPNEAAEISARIEMAERNLAWLSAHWADFLPQARGKFVAVVAQQGYVAESAEEAWAWAKTIQPNAEGALVQYVRPEIGPRIYACRRQMESMR